MKNFIYIFIILLVVACGNNKEESNEANTVDAGKVYTPVQMNDRIMALESSLEEPMLKAEAEIKVRSGNNNAVGVAQSAKAMEDSIQIRIDEIKKISPVGKGGEDYKTVAIRYFDYLKSIYTTYREISEAKDDNARAEKINKMQSISTAQAAVMANLQQAQQKYAADNGFVY